MTYFMYHQINVLVIVPMILTPTQSFIFQQSDLLRDILPSNDAGDLIPADTIAITKPNVEEFHQVYDLAVVLRA